MDEDAKEECWLNGHDGGILIGEREPTRYCARCAADLEADGYEWGIDALIGENCWHKPASGA